MGDMDGFGLGAIPSGFDEGDAAYHFLTTAAAAAPRPVLPVQLPALPPGHPWDQDSLGTCVGNGVGLAAVIAIHKATGKWIVRDAVQGEALAKDLYHLANPSDPTYRRGAIIRDALKAAQKIGVLGGDGKRHKIGPYRSLLPSADIRSDIERAIAAGMAVVTGWHWPDMWVVANPPFDTLPDPPKGASLAGGHCVCLWRAVMKHPRAGSPALRRDHSIENSWDKRFTRDGAAYVNAALEVTGWLFDAWIIE